MSPVDTQPRVSQPSDSGQKRQATVSPRRLDPRRLRDHIAVLHRAARALCGTPQDAEDLVEDTSANVLARSRLLRSDNEVGYLLQALRNTHANRARADARRPRTVPLLDTEPLLQEGYAISFDAREVITAIAAAPKHYQEAVVAVDIKDLSSKQAGRQLRAPVATIASRVLRGRQLVARSLEESRTRGRRCPP